MLLGNHPGFDAAFIGDLLCKYGVHGGSLEIPLTFFKLHRPRLIAVNHPPWRSLVVETSISSIISGSVCAWDSTAPVSGQQPSVRKRTILF